MTVPVAEAKAVSKRFQAIDALRDVDVAINAGDIVALLGPNGAGKTTLMRLVTGLISADAGTVLLFGKDPKQPASRSEIGATPQDTAFPDALTVNEIVDLVRAHYATPAPRAELLDRFGLGGLADRRAGAMSGGERRRLALALAFAGTPKAVFLDEPTTGLDPAARRDLWQALKDYAEDGGTIVFSTHYLEEAEMMASRVLLLDHGRIVEEGSVEAVRGSVGLTRIEFDADSCPPLVHVVAQQTDGTHHVLHSRDADSLVRELVDKNVPFQGLRVEPLSLEDAILARTDRAS